VDEPPVLEASPRILVARNRGSPFGPRPLVWSIAALAIGLRVASLGWNDRLQGDVNLFALTAREVARNGRLVYPMRYEYSDRVPYLSFETPATQHPPLWPFSAGLLDPEALKRLVHDFGVRYVWVDTATRRDARHLFRDATPRLRNARYAVLELPIGEAAPRANPTAPAADSTPPTR